MPIISGEELHIWRRQQLQINPGAAAGLDWLLEMEGKVPWGLCKRAGYIQNNH